jgi:ribosomal protein S18 acetylase RimI-like enzyme
MIGNIAIRRAKAADLEVVIRLDKIGTGLAKPGYWQDMFARYVRRRREGRHFLVAEADKTTVGFVVGEVRAWEFGSPPCGWVFAVNVAPECRAQGIGGRLFDEICTHFADAGVDTVRTMISRADTLNLSFFRAQGLAAGPYIELERHLA